MGVASAVFTPSIDEGLLDGDESVAMEAIDGFLTVRRKTASKPS